MSKLDILIPWIDYQEAKFSCQKLGLIGFIEEIEEKEIKEDVDLVFLHGFYRIWVDLAGEQLEQVRKFRKNTHENYLQNFIDLDSLQCTIAQSRIREKLIAKLPSQHQTLSKAKDELSVLLRELDKKRKLLPIRELFRKIPNLLMRLKPCLMMSPLSVASLLEAEAYQFDLVIFDEASQIYPQDAIGAILRGKQIIVVGDSKQLPPSSFFTSQGTNQKDDFVSEEEQSSEMGDSILEEAVTILHSRTLRWHYRSKHESLITFSNQNIYKNNLITFPSKVTMESDVGLEFVYVEDGYYESGGKSCNVKEAQKCTELVLQHILTHPNRSLGIIAFSEKQQSAIMDCIHHFREHHPEFEYFFDESKDEPFFVKNLENVQGDERDTILFSICYAKEKGKDTMAMRFGPLGQVGGERRLNVAITRAKQNIKLVSSIIQTDIDLNRTNAEGVKLLRSYIEYARLQSGYEEVKKESEQSKDFFVSIIAEFLRKEGYSVKESVGESQYKLDIIVENPEKVGEYAVVIECDGISYQQATTARDRDHLRTAMLKNMGWYHYRLWSTEWVRNTEREEKALLSFIRKAYLIENTQKPLKIEAETVDKPLFSMNDFEEVVKTPDLTEEEKQNPYGFEYFQEFSGFTDDDFCAYQDYAKIATNILKILNVEGPILLERLYKRLLPCFLSEKATKTVKNSVDLTLENALVDQVLKDEDNFLLVLPKDEGKVRIPQSNSSARYLHEICKEEIGSAIIVILSASFGLTMEELTAEIVQVFGFTRPGVKQKEQMKKTVNYLLDQKKIRFVDDKIQLITE